ncbi:DUF421 domain-containing protein [Rathayibacter oskolensis]|uniref:DUF421 domain-containing protein n=1 Tax=Rathayibacter oskolensis TaxID=1891671 RepID=UPI00265E5EED|nr:YetF domain-containing protein [Rathayibacter oskolensis]WKK70314.1 DUF421 domain-containing protein [Rathayibacter oskolensis]
MWFDTWSDVIRTLVLGASSYVTLVALLRFSGKRTLSQLNAFDFVVTVALGSTLATILLSSDVSWAEGAAALLLLAGLQFVVAWSTARWQRLRGLVTSSPRVLLRDGVLDAVAVRSVRLTDAEVRQAVRSSGSGDLSSIAAVVLETNGTLSVIPRVSFGNGSAMADLDA